MPTKKELEDQIKVLKDEIRKLRGEAKQAVTDMESLTKTAHGVFIDGKGFCMATIKFNPETNSAAIADVKKLKDSLVLASHEVKTAVLDNVLEENKRR